MYKVIKSTIKEYVRQENFNYHIWLDIVCDFKDCNIISYNQYLKLVRYIKKIKIKVSE